MLEKDIEKKLVREICIRGGRAYKFTSPGNAGVPDRIVVLPQGRIWFVELKTNTGRLSHIQARQINRLIGMGCEVRVVKGLKGLAEFLEEVDAICTT